MSNTKIERSLVEAWFAKYKGRRARGMWYKNNTMVYGTIYAVGGYDLGVAPTVTHWTVALEEKAGPKKLVVFSSVQLLDDLTPGCEYEGNLIRPTQQDVEAGVKAAEEMMAKPKHCHPECTDGYCHRAYMSGIIRAKGV